MLIKIRSRGSSRELLPRYMAMLDARPRGAGHGGAAIVPMPAALAGARLEAEGL